MPYMIVERDGEYCVYKQNENGRPEGEALGCHETREDAERQIRAIWASEQAQAWLAQEGPIWISRETIRAICPNCANAMEAKGLDRINIKAMPEQLLRGLCEKLGGDEGFFTRCMEFDFGEFEPDNREGFCAWLHHACIGKWPGERSYRSVPAVEMEDALIVGGGAVKALGNGKVGGYLVLFTDPSSPDLEGDYFDANTDLDFYDGERTSVYYDHGFDPDLGVRKLADGVLVHKDAGVWFETQLNLRDEYERMIYELAERGKLGLSSGTAGHLVEYDEPEENGARHIRKWPLRLDASFTPTPAEPRTMARPIKATEYNRLRVRQSLKMLYASEVGTEAGGSRVSATTSAQGKSRSKEQIKDGEGREMEEQKNERIDALEEQLKHVSTALDALLKHVENTPAVANAGYISMDGGAADKDVRSFGDFLLAVRRGDVKRLRTVYQSVKAMEEGEGASGGYLVPREYYQQLLQAAFQASPILSLVQRITVNTAAGDFPVLDQFVTPTAGSGETALAAGAKASKRAESGSFTETAPQFEMLTFRVQSLGGIVRVSQELMEDSPLAIEQLLRGLFQTVIQSKLERDILRGSGVGEPLGVLSADCAIGITPATNNVFAYADALNMLAHFKPVGGRPVWVIHPSLWPDIGQFEIGTAGAGAFVANMQAALSNVLFGYPIVQSEHLPAADSSGAALLADFGAYLLFERGDMRIAYSEERYLEYGQVAWRFWVRVDGRPWLRSKITLADPQGSYQVSPFVYHND